MTASAFLRLVSTGMGLPSHERSTQPRSRVHSQALTRASSSELIGRQVLDALGEHGVEGEDVRVVDPDVRFGVSVEGGHGPVADAPRNDARRDILVRRTPIWMGQPASVGKLVLERLDAGISQTDEGGPTAQRSARSPRSLSSATRTAHTTRSPRGPGSQRHPRQRGDERRHLLGRGGNAATDYHDHDETPEATASATKALAANAARVTQLLKARRTHPSQTVPAVRAS